ncbi:hypothetical protein AVEN_96499-1 [Araneus ventricosus]|uniref:Uncharacterized protein n=1 Tax=Araneus ventricosus TaxID=182803 RepID=A0A4Y2CU33_ARAVE|nr:hypothetical protein AVEN_96499-1 [Araneus ventricosus]
MKYIPFDSLTLDLLFRGKEVKKIHTLKNQTGNQKEMNHSLPNVKFDFNGVGHSRVHCAFQGADSDSDKEVDDMGCDHQQMKFSAQQTSGKIDYIIVHS